MQLEDLNLVAAASRPGSEIETRVRNGSYSFPKGRDVLVALPKGYGPRKKRFCHCQRGFQESIAPFHA